jgi:hypothetical protein
MTDGGTGSLAQTIIEQILHEYQITNSGGMSRFMDRELRVPVTESAPHSYRFSGLYYIDIAVDDYLEGIPISFTATVSESRSESLHGGYEALLACQTNLDEPDYAYWEFRDFFKRLAEGGYIGSFRMQECGQDDELCGVGLRYDYTLPVPDDGNIPLSMIECVVSRFLDDVSRAAVAYFQRFFYYLPLHHTVDKPAVTAQTPCPECNRTCKVIPFPVNRRIKAR